MAFDVDYYTLPNGKQPVADFLDGLDVKMRVKAFRSISLLEEFGNGLREPDSKSLGDGLFELRIKFAGDIARVFYFFVVNNKIVLTNGFIKKSSATPKRELELARKYKADYERMRLHE
jgi:phage-related protein